MKIRTGETAEQRQETMNELYNDGKTLRIVAAVVLVVGIAIALVFHSNTAFKPKITPQKGNPYTCEACRNAGRACHKHTDFDAEAAFKDKVYFVCERYTSEDDEEHRIYDTYGYGNMYNTDCDFCSKQKSECYSCEQDRLRIFEAVDVVTEDDNYSSELCAECKELGYANCTKCRDMLKYKVYTELKK